jgi:hypothetical protein
VPWEGQRALVLGHGPYAIENARTALENHATHVTFGVRRHGIICPELVGYVNYVRDYDENFAHPLSGSNTVVSVWQKVYAISKATPPECWREGHMIPDGHTCLFLTSILWRRTSAC